MKKFVCLFCFVLIAISAHAQQKTYYCEVKGIEKDFASGLKIIFDFGETASYTAGGLNRKLVFVDEKGEEIKFNSMVDVANYMVDRGWEFVQAYSSVYDKSPIIHYIFSKNANSPEEAREGIITKEEFKSGAVEYRRISGVE